MDERIRREYLDAMGITVWVSRGVEAHPGVPSGNGGSVSGNDSRAVETGVVEASTPVGECGDDTASLGWDELQEKVSACQSCALSETRTQTVFGVGDREADLLVIGEAPGADEDRQGEPFVGRAGKLLNAMLEAIGLRREKVFIANILKCRPPGNRDPRPEEALRCAPFLSRQIELVRPRVILSVGRISAQNLLNTDTPVGKLRGRVHQLRPFGIPLVVTYHPAYLLRSPDQKARAWQDLQLAIQVLRGQPD